MTRLDYAPTDVVLYECLFRHYRNAVVEHVRSCLTVSLGAGAADALRPSLGDKAWTDLVDKAKASEARGAVARPRVDDFDLLDIGVFRGLLDHFYNELVPDKWHGTHEKTSKAELGRWMQDVKNARDPAAHPGSLEVDTTDAVRAVDAALRVLRRLGTRLGQEELEGRLTELFERAARPHELGAVAPLDDTLPLADSVVQDFVGRGNELAQLRAWLTHPHKNRWMLVGDGGKGKSAIAYAFASEVIEVAPTWLCGAFWLSAKRRRYATDRVVDIPTPDFSTLGDCLDRILLDYGDQSALELELEERQSLVLSYLNDLPVLLVVDDLDSVDEEHEDVVEFLTLVAPQTASKVLITSRRKFAGMGASSTQVHGLPESDAVEFVRTRWSATGLDRSVLAKDAIRSVIEACEGSPLYMGDLLRLCAVAVKKGQANIADVVADWKAHDGAAVRSYALQREMDMLSANSRHVLQALAVAGRSMTIVELAKVTGLTELTIDTAASELQQLYLLGAPALDDETPRFAIDGNLAVLVRSEVQGSPRQTQLQNAIQAIDGKGLPTRAAAESRDKARQARLLLNAGRTAEAERLLANALENSPDDALLLALLGMCFVAWQPRRTIDARDCFTRASDLGYSDRGMFMAWSRIEGQAGDWSRAVNAAERGLSFRPGDPMLLLAAGRAKRSLAKQHLRALSQEKAKDCYEDADSYFEQAIAEARKLRLRSVDISTAFDAWVASARDQSRPKAACYRLGKWESWKRRDPKLKSRIAEHAGECPDGRHRAQ